MPKILVLYYSMYGHIETMAGAIAEGAKSVEGAEVIVKRVPETMPPDVAAKAGAKLDQAAPVASPKGGTYRVRRPADAALSYDGHVPLLGEGQWRASFARYDVRW